MRSATKAEIAGFVIARRGVVGSTNDEARARSGERRDIAVIARAQRAGRGRSGRDWLSPPGNLYLSVTLKPERPRAEWGGLALVVGLATIEALATLRGAEGLSLKWPNDVLCDGAKIAGVLLEAESEAVIAGVGVNLKEAPKGLDRPVAALNATGRAIAAEALLEPILTRLRARFETWSEGGFEPLSGAWLKWSAPIGGAAAVRLGRERIEGRFAGLDSRTGALAIDCDGRRRLVSAGEIVM